MFEIHFYSRLNEQISFFSENNNHLPIKNNQHPGFQAVYVLKKLNLNDK